MKPTTIVRAILRDYPSTRYDETDAYMIHLIQFFSGSISIDSPIKINTFLRIWQRYRRSIN
jgi:hypothetical protein